MKSYVIAIKGNPRSVEAAKRCIKSAKKFGIDVDMFDAVTPADDPSKFLREEGIDPFSFKEKYSRFDNVISCFSSHYKLWKQCIQDKQNYLIFEHDAVVKADIPVDRPFRGLISFGQPSYGNFITPPIFGINKLVSKQYLPGAHAYMIKPVAAKKLIAQAKVYACPTDVFLHNQRFDFLEEYYPWPVVADDSFTTVQNKNGCQAKHNYRKNPEQYEIV